MALTTRNPLRFTGGVVNSGNVDTGEIAFTQGGQRTACVFSGAIAMGVVTSPTGALSSGGSILVVSGQGRINTFTALWPAGVALAGVGENACISGQPIVVYDSAITARSGVLTDATIAESGRKILYAWSPPKLVASGAVLLNARTVYDPVKLDIPYFSGLCVMALSGAPGFAIGFTPDRTTSGNANA